MFPKIKINLLPIFLVFFLAFSLEGLAAQEPAVEQICQKDGLMGSYDTDPIKMPSTKGSFYICGSRNGEARSGPGYLLSENDVHFVTKDRNEVILIIDSLGQEDVSLDGNGDLKIITWLNTLSDSKRDRVAYENIISCDEKKCKSLPTKCLLKKDPQYAADLGYVGMKKKIYDYMTKKEYVVSSNEIFEYLELLYLGAVNGNKDAQNILNDAELSKILGGGEMAETLDDFVRSYQAIKEICNIK
jgi:hypothetical protein